MTQTLGGFRHTALISLSEAKTSESDGRVLRDCRLLESGFTKVGGRYYEPEALHAAAPLFSGTRLLLGHGTRAQLNRTEDRPVVDIIGVVESARIWEGRGKVAIDGDLRFLDAGQSQRADETWSLASNPMTRRLMGLSWEGDGRGRFMLREGRRCVSIRQLTEVDGVAVVMQPNAGGALGSLAESMLREEEALLLEGLREFSSREELEAAYPQFFAESRGMGGLSPEGVMRIVESAVKAAVEPLNQRIEAAMTAGAVERRRQSAGRLIAESKLPEKAIKLVESGIDYTMDDDKFEDAVKGRIVEMKTVLSESKGGKTEGDPDGSEGGSGDEPDVKRLAESGDTMIRDIMGTLDLDFTPAASNGAGGN